VTDYTFAPPRNFLGLDAQYSRFAESGGLVLPVPYETTTCYKSGTKQGPQAIIDASVQVELYDTELECEPALLWGVHTLPSLLPSLHSPERAVENIAAAVAHYASLNRVLGVLGGEHSVSVGVARGLHQSMGKFLTVQLDAHADLRDSYDGTPYSHACTARRILEVSDIIQLGIRSLDVSEAEFLRHNRQRVVTFYAEEMHKDHGYLDRLAAKVEGNNVYLTIDVDVLDSSVMPSTGTPEPGGLWWHQVVQIVRTLVTHSRIIAFDCVELSPISGLHAPDYLAAKLVTKMLNLLLADRFAGKR